jgi:hypothetical protein
MTPFGRAVLIERNWLALSDPVGEDDAHTPILFDDAYRYLVHELAENSRHREVLSQARKAQLARAQAGALVDLLGIPPGRTCGMVRCPAHEDRGPSLSWRLTSTGRLLVHCFAGCSFDEIRAAVA